MDRSRVANFYGWTHDYIMSMRYRDFLDYLNSIEAVKCVDYSYLKNISIYGKLSQKGRDKLDRSMKKAYSNIVETSKEKISTKNEALTLARKMTGG